MSAFLPFARPEIDEATIAGVAEVLRSGWITSGPQVQAFEAALSRLAGGRAVRSFSSGTAALEVALRLAGIGEGDEVITTPFTFFATGGAVARLGARPLFCDIDPVTYNLSAESVADLIATGCEWRSGELANRRTGGRVKVLMPVHLFGQMADMDGLMEVAARNGLKVVEDAAQAIGAEDEAGHRAGSVGDIGCFSFFPSKNLGAFGDAGMCTTNDPQLAARMEALRVHGGKRKYHHEIIGGNFRLDELQAAFLRVKLPHLPRWTARRRALAAHYRELLAGLPLGLPPADDGCVWNQLVVRVPGGRREALAAHLASRGVATVWLVFPVTLFVRGVAAYFVSARVLGARINWLLLPIEDLMGFFFWLAGFFGNTISWRDRRYLLHADGRFELISSTPK